MILILSAQSKYYTCLIWPWKHSIIKVLAKSGQPAIILPNQSLMIPTTSLTNTINRILRNLTLLFTFRQVLTLDSQTARPHTLLTTKSFLNRYHISVVSRNATTPVKFVYFHLYGVVCREPKKKNIDISVVEKGITYTLRWIIVLTKWCEEVKWGRSYFTDLKIYRLLMNEEKKYNRILLGLGSQFVCFFLGLLPQNVRLVERILMILFLFENWCFESSVLNVCPIFRNKHTISVFMKFRVQ